jgi:hypothetical protein
MFSSFSFDVHVLQRIVYNTYAEMSIILRYRSCFVREGLSEGSL